MIRGDLRHAANRFEAAGRQIAADQAAGRMPRRRLLPEDYIRRRALYLPQQARFDWIMQQAALGGTALPKLVNDAMTAIKENFAPLAGVLPRDYGIFEQKKVGNGNYLWISYFWSYLNAHGRAGFVMSSQASSAGHGEKEVRRKLIETGDLDLMISIRANFFFDFEQTLRDIHTELADLNREAAGLAVRIAENFEGLGL